MIVKCPRGHEYLRGKGCPVCKQHRKQAYNDRIRQEREEGRRKNRALYPELFVSLPREKRSGE